MWRVTQVSGQWVPKHRTGYWKGPTTICCKPVRRYHQLMAGSGTKMLSKRIDNLPPHLSYVSTLPDITQNRNTALTSWSRGSLTLGTVFLRASSTKPLANMAACMCKDKGRHFEHLLWSSPTTGSEPLETPQNQFFSEPLTLLRGRQHKFSVFM